MHLTSGGTLPWPQISGPEEDACWIFCSPETPSRHISKTLFCEVYTHAEGDAKSHRVYFSRQGFLVSFSIEFGKKFHVSIFLASYHGNHELAVLLWIHRRQLPLSLHIEKRRCMRALWHSCAPREEIDPHTLPPWRVSYLCNACLQTFVTEH